MFQTVNTNLHVKLADRRHLILNRMNEGTFQIFFGQHGFKRQEVVDLAIFNVVRINVHMRRSIATSNRKTLALS